MRTVQATEAKAHLSELLRNVERGATVAITRHGQTIAHVVPARSGADADRKEMVARFRRRARLTSDTSMERLNALRDLPIRTDSEPQLDVAWALAERHRLSFYDAVNCFPSLTAPRGRNNLMGLFDNGVKPNLS